VFVHGVKKIVRTVLCVVAVVLAAISIGAISYGEHFLTLATFQKLNTASQWTVVSRVPSFYGNHAVVDYSSPNGTQWRGLLTGGLINNRVNSDGVSASMFTHALELLSFSGNTPPNNILIMGLGAGIMATNLKNMGANVDVIELDAVVEEIAREYFSFKGDGIPVTIEDARTYVRNCQKKYDVVIVDLFKGDGIPSHVVSQEFFSDIKYCLNDDGAIVMNAFYGTKDLRSKKALLKTIVSVFAKIIVFETPQKPSAEMTQGYTLARKSQKWAYNTSLQGMPEFVIKSLSPTLKNRTVYATNSELLKNTLPIYDNKNDWKRISSYIDVAYRKILTGVIPWQVLLD